MIPFPPITISRNRLVRVPRKPQVPALAKTATWLVALGPWLAITSPAAAQVPQIVTQVQHAGRDLTIYANGIPVAEASGDETSHIFQIGSFLIDGENAIRFEWTRTRPEAFPFSAVVQENRPPEGLTDIVTVDEVSDDPVGEITARAVSIQVAIPRPWAWQNAPTINLDADERGLITAAVEELHGSFAEGDAPRAMALTRMMWLEMAGFDEPRVDRVNVRYNEMMAAPEWSIEPLNASALTIEQFGPLVRVLADGPLIQSAESASGARLSLRGLFFAKIDGEWRPVRPVS